MARVHHGGTLVAQAHDAVEDGVTALRVHGNGRFVEEDELGRVRDAARDVEPAQQAAGKLSRAHLAIVFQAHELDGPLHQLAAARRIAHIQRAEAVDVLSHGQLVEHGHLLRDHANAPLEVVARRRHTLVEQLDGAFVVGKQLQHAVHGRGLAAAVRAEQTENLAFLDFQVEMVQGEHIAVALHKVADRDHRMRRCWVVHVQSHPFRFSKGERLPSRCAFRRGRASASKSAGHALATWLAVRRSRPSDGASQATFPPS